jgi:uncharacterized protein with HEPN domain
MSERAAPVLLGDMLEAVERILAYTQGLDFAQFVTDRKTSDAVLRNFQVLGEAARRVPPPLRQEAPEIEWVRITRSRHIVVHDYFGIDYEIVWRIIQVHLPPLRTALQAFLERLSPPS